MKRSFAAGLGLLAFALAMPASAADLPRSMPYKAPAYMAGYNWTGLYLGINGGGAWGDSDWNGGIINNSPSGAMIGLTAGYNWQALGSPWVFGLEGDIDWTNIRDSSPCGAGTSCETRNDWLGTFRGRVGYSWDRVMPYVTGGLALGNVKAAVPGVGSWSDTNVGWTIGAGVEAVVAGNWTAKVEYLYADLGDTSCGALCGGLNNVDLRLNTVRAGFNHRF
jgi:outer membrane immunogenic protein